MRQDLLNDVRAQRAARGWSQEELARRSGLSRPEISAIETGRLVPSTLAALALADAFSCRIEHLFRRGPGSEPATPWAWPPSREPARYWKAEVRGRTRLYPVEITAAGALPHDGLWPSAAPEPPHDIGEPSRPTSTLLLAGCDPAVGLLRAELARVSRVRLIPLSRSSRAAIQLLRDGLVHVAGMHLAGSEGRGHARLVHELLGSGYGLVRVTSWEEGIPLPPGSRLASVGAVLGARMRWVGREPGSGARLCLDELLGPKRAPRRLATDHRGVAEAVRAGWADAGVCLKLTCEEAGLEFLSVRREPYDLCFPLELADDHRLVALLATLRSGAFRRWIAELPGYDNAMTGERVDDD